MCIGCSHENIVSRRDYILLGFPCYCGCELNWRVLVCYILAVGCWRRVSSVSAPQSKPRGQSPPPFTMCTAARQACATSLFHVLRECYKVTTSATLYSLVANMQPITYTKLNWTCTSRAVAVKSTPLPTPSLLHGGIFLPRSLVRVTTRKNLGQ